MKYCGVSCFSRTAGGKVHDEGTCRDHVSGGRSDSKREGIDEGLSSDKQALPEEGGGFG